jgi:hypothetical protein
MGSWKQGVRSGEEAPALYHLNPERIRGFKPEYKDGSDGHRVRGRTEFIPHLRSCHEVPVLRD